MASGTSTSVDLNNCDREAIHLINAIQPHGTLLAAQRSSGQIVYLSGNVPEVLKKQPSDLLGSPMELFLEGPARSILQLDHDGSEFSSLAFHYQLIWQGASFDVSLRGTTLYVKEGSNLGGQVIYRSIHKSLHLTPASGAAFFHGHGAETGARWRGFCSFLQDQAEQIQVQASIVDAAKWAFIHFREIID